MRVRRALLALILDIVRREQLTAYSIAYMCGTSRTRASNLMHGHIARFNSETLIDILARLGVTVDITVVNRRPFLQRARHWPARPGWRPPPGLVY
jgi:predicted XRE-type DNA-binding protein